MTHQAGDAVEWKAPTGAWVPATVVDTFLLLTSIRLYGNQQVIFVGPERLRRRSPEAACG